jgi:hypothetical protein
MSPFTPHESVNPWDEGHYRIHRFAAVAPDGGYWPAYSIERIHGIPDAPKEVVARYEVRAQVFSSDELAKMMGISHGVNRVRENDRLDS